MARTQLTGNQTLDGTIQRADLDAVTAGSAVIKKIIAGTGVTITSTGVDAGTGDVTISAAAGGLTAVTVLVDFTNKDPYQYFTVTDAAISPSATPKNLFISRGPGIDDSTDLELDYVAVLVAVNTGNFTVRVVASDPEGADLNGIALQSQTLNYLR